MSRAGTACTDWHPGQRQEEAGASEPEEAGRSETEAGARAHLRMQGRWKMEKQLAQDQTGADRRTAS
jgi:hypothetical protein